MTPGQQQRWLANQATALSSNVLILSEAAQFASPESPLTARAYHTATQSGENSHAMWAFSDISTRGGTFGERSWRRALHIARRIRGLIGFGPDRPYALESLAYTQDDTGRLHEIADVAGQGDRCQRLEVLSAIGKQHAANGNIIDALAARQQAQDKIFADPAAEIDLAIIDAGFAENDGLTSWMAFGRLPHTMRAWGMVKMARHGHHPEPEVLPPQLEDVWHQFNLRQQREIITDLLAAGDSGQALELARRIVSPGRSHTYWHHRTQENALIQIAEHHADNGDVPRGLEIVDQMAAEAEAGLNTLIDEGMNLSYASTDPADQEAVRRHERRHNELTITLAHAQGTAISLRARRSARFALQQMDRSAFYGDDHNRISNIVARRQLANTFARLGLLREAVAVALSIDNQNDRMLQEEQASVFLDIARAIGRSERAPQQAAPLPAAEPAPLAHAA
jgi:hypothetical protein